MSLHGGQEEESSGATCDRTQRLAAPRGPGTRMQKGLVDMSLLQEQANYTQFSTDEPEKPMIK